MKVKETILVCILVSGAVLLSSCATIVNDPNIPVNFVFEDGSNGECKFKNKRGSWSCEMPCNNVLIRRSDDNLVYDCVTADGKELNGSIQSQVEGGKMAASVIFWDLGITDAITDKHRRYQSNVIIPMEEGKSMLISEKGNSQEETPKVEDKEKEISENSGHDEGFEYKATVQ